jgi:hypothetical protein
MCQCATLYIPTFVVIHGSLITEECLCTELLINHDLVDHYHGVLCHS